MKHYFEQHKELFIQLLIIVVGSLLFLPGLGSVHLFDWDEINFAESAREMLTSGDWLTVQINYQPFWEKPPLFIWMQALSMHLFGVTEFAARLPNAICGIVTLCLLFNIGNYLKGIRFGLLWMLLYLCSIFPFFYFKTGIIDPWFNLFILLGVYCFIRFTEPNNSASTYWQVALSGLFLGLAILTKGPVAFLIFLLTFTVYLFVNRFKLTYSWKEVLLFVGVLSFVGCFWFILQIINGNYTIIQDFIVYQIRLFKTQDAGHGGFFGYHFLIMLIGVFPASVIALPTFRRSVLKTEESARMAHAFRWMMILFWVVIILFTIVKTKIVHYSSMGYFPLAFLAAWYADKVLDGKAKFYPFMRWIIFSIALIFAIAITIVTLFDQLKTDYIIPYVDPFTAGNLQATSSWVGVEPLFGLVMVGCVIAFMVQIKREASFRALGLLFAGTLFFTFTTLFFVVPQVEKYTQAAVIEFYKKRIGEDCYTYSIHKSYAPYFYTQRQPENSCADFEFLSRGDIDKPCYFVVRNRKKEVDYLKSNVENALCLYVKNGFVFYVRYPQVVE